MCEKHPGKPRGVLQDDNHAFSKPACCERDTAPSRGIRTRSGGPNPSSCLLLENKPEPHPSPFPPAEQSSPKIGRGRLILEAGRVAPGSVNEEMGPTRSTRAGGQQEKACGCSAPVLPYHEEQEVQSSETDPLPKLCPACIPPGEASF